MKRVLSFDGFLNEANEYRSINNKYLLDNFYEVSPNSKMYNPKEEDFQDLPWYKAIKGAFPEFRLDRIRRGSKGGCSWFFKTPVLGRRGTHDQVYEVHRPSDRDSPSEDYAKIQLYGDSIIRPSDLRVYLNDKSAWNQIFKIIYFGLFSGSPLSDSRSIDHITNLFSTDLEDLYKEGGLAIVGVKKDCNPYGGHYRSSTDFLKNLPYGIYDKIKEVFIKKIEEEPGVIQYAISQCQLPKSSAEKKFGDTRFYPENEVLDFYNQIKKEGYVPPRGFEEETKEISDLQSSLGDIGL